jgi:hypothetical protein
MGLFVSTDVCCCGADADVSRESEEGKDDEEDTTFKDGGFQEGMFWCVEPCLEDVLGFSFELIVGAVSRNNIVKSLVVTLFIQLIR